MPKTRSQARRRDDALRPRPVETPELFAPAKRPATLLELPVLGLDMAKRSFQASLQKPAQRAVEKEFGNDAEGFAALEKWLLEHGAPRTYAGLEATGSYSHALLFFLHEKGHRVCLLNPRWVKDYARSQGRRNKTDVVDARVMVGYLLSHEVRQWEPGTQAQQKLQALYRRRCQLVEIRIAEKLRLEHAAKDVIKSLRSSLNHLEGQVQALDLEIDKTIKADPELDQQRQWLLSIPSIGKVTAVAILAEMPPLQSFERIRDAAAWVGLTPALNQSGPVHGRSRMNKQGNPRLRKALYMPAVTLLRSKVPNAMTALARRLREAGKHEMVIVGALMRKLFQVACGVLKHRQSFNASLT